MCAKIAILLYQIYLIVYFALVTQFVLNVQIILIYIKITVFRTVNNLH